MARAAGPVAPFAGSKECGEGGTVAKGLELAATEGWSLPATSARFVGSRLAKALERLGVSTIEELLFHVPARYLDMGDVRSISSVKNGEQVTVAGVVRQVLKRRARRGLSVLNVGIFDGTGYLFGTWFNQDFIAGRLKEGTRVAFSGKASFEYGRLQMPQPLFDILGDRDSGEERVHTSPIIPIYAATEGLSSNMPVTAGMPSFSCTAWQTAPQAMP